MSDTYSSDEVTPIIDIPTTINGNGDDIVEIPEIPDLTTFDED